eukprot:SAG31_NODE_27313_length_428_cov_0.696049_2_plen_49_part_01
MADYLFDLRGFRVLKAALCSDEVPISPNFVPISPNWSQLVPIRAEAWRG